MELWTSPGLEAGLQDPHPSDLHYSWHPLWPGAKLSPPQQEAVLSSVVLMVQGLGVWKRHGLVALVATGMIQKPGADVSLGTLPIARWDCSHGPLLKKGASPSRGVSTVLDALLWCSPDSLYTRWQPEVRGKAGHDCFPVLKV